MGPFLFVAELPNGTIARKLAMATVDEAILNEEENGRRKAQKQKFNI